MIIEVQDYDETGRPFLREVTVDVDKCPECGSTDVYWDESSLRMICVDGAHTYEIED